MPIEIRVPQTYPPYCTALLEQLFADTAVATVTKHFTEGQSGTFVFLVEPTQLGGEPALPVVVKIGPRHLLEQEWRAAQDHIASRLPDFVPISGALATITVTAADGSRADYSAARYQLAGNGVFTIETLRDYATTASPAALWTVLEKRLFAQLDRIWSTRKAPVIRSLGAAYDRVLPVNLLLEFAEAATTAAVCLDATQDPASYPQLQPGDWVQLNNFVISEIDEAERALTLNLPQLAGLRTHAYRLRIRQVADLKQYKLDATVSSLTGRVVTTRQQRLQAALRPVLPATVDLTRPVVQTPDSGVELPNPLGQWPSLLQEQLAMRIGTVHGDLNMGNVLIDVGAKTTFIIDCAHAHDDHVLVDLVRLESEVLLHLVAARFFELQLPPTTIYALYGWLDYVTQRAPNPAGIFSVPQPLLQASPALESAFIALTIIRNHARQYLAVRDQWREYYAALALTLLGSLKFASLDRALAGTNPKAVAFWGAATLLAQLDASSDFIHLGWQRIDVNEAAAQPNNPAATPSNVYIDYGDVTHDHRQGVFFEGNQSVTIEGNVISGGTVNTTNFHGAVMGPIHTGSGDIQVGGPASEISKSQKPGVATPPTSGTTESAAELHNHTGIHNAQGSFISTGSGAINVDQSRHVSLHLFTFSLDAVKSWAHDFFRRHEADEHARSSWAGMTLYLLGATMKRISDEGLLAFLLTAFTAALAIWFIAPILAWPQPAAQARLFAAIRFGIAAFVLPLLIAALIKPEGTEKFPMHENATQRKLLALKLAGAWTGFGALAGTALTVAIVWYHLRGSPLPPPARWLLALLPPFFAYVSARRIPLDRYKMFNGELRLHDADPLFLTVFALFGPALAALVYWGHWFLINPAVMLSALLGIIGLTVWEIHRRDKSRFPDLLVIAILGVLLPLGFLLLFFFDMRPLGAPVTFIPAEVGIFAVLSVYMLGTTLLLATVGVRQPTVITLRGTLSLLALLLFMLGVSVVNLWLGRAVVIGLLLLWYGWGRRQLRDWAWLWVHPSVDWLIAALIGAAVLGRYTTLPLGANATLFGVMASVLVLWAYRKNENAIQNQPQPEPAQGSPFFRWGVVLFVVIVIIGITFVVRNFSGANSPRPTPAEIATNAPTVVISINPTKSPTPSATVTLTATSALERLTVARPASGANRYFIEGPDLARYELEELLAVYAQDAAGLEFDAAVVLVVDKNVGNLIVQVIFQNEDHLFDSLSALQLDDRLDNVDLASMKPIDSSFVGFMLTEATIRLVADAPIKVGAQLEAMQLTRGGDTLPFSDGPLMVHIDSIGTDRKVARVSSTTALPPLGTLLILPTEPLTATSAPAPSPTQLVTPTATDPPTPQPQSNLPIDESFDGIVELNWENSRGEWGVNNQRLQVRRFEDGLAGIVIAHPTWTRYVVQLDFGTIKHLDDSGDVNVPFTNFHVLIHFQGGTDGYWFTVANGGVACTKHQNNVGTPLSPSTSQWGEMFDLLALSYTGDHKLKITVRDNQYTFTLNEEEICSFQDDTYPAGSLGVVVSEGASGFMWIDNVRIMPLD